MFNGGTHNSNNGMYDFSDLSQWTYADDSTQVQLDRLSHIPMPAVWTHKGTKDSAYESYETEDDRLMIEPPMSTAILDSPLGEYNFLSGLAPGELHRDLFLGDEFNDLEIQMG